MILSLNNRTQGAGIASGNFTLNRLGWYAESGTHTVTVTVDAGGSVVETNETDNSASFLFTPASATDLPQKFVWPLDGEPGPDHFLWAYVDLDPAGGFRDYTGGSMTYNGHNAIDAGSPNFSQMDTGFVYGWVDFNQDGDWDDPDEQVFADVAVVSGANNLQIAVPSGATLVSTFARFRLTVAAGYSDLGLAPNGEVEDYQLMVADPPPDSADSFTQETLTPSVLTTLPPWRISTPSSIHHHSLITIPARPFSFFAHPLSMFPTGLRSRPRGR